jgi:hypothetical protein
MKAARSNESIFSILTYSAGQAERARNKIKRVVSVTYGWGMPVPGFFGDAVLFGNE